MSELCDLTDVNCGRYKVYVHLVIFIHFQFVFPFYAYFLHLFNM